MIDPPESFLQAAYKVLLRSDDYEVTRTYCVCSVPTEAKVLVKHAVEGVAIFNRVFSDTPMPAKNRVALHFEEYPADKERSWKRSVRDKAPELKEDLMPELTNRHSSQKNLARSKQLALRRRPLREAIKASMQQRRRKQERQTAERRRLGIKQKAKASK